jgi:hypothetical protein
MSFEHIWLSISHIFSGIDHFPPISLASELLTKFYFGQSVMANIWHTVRDSMFTANAPLNKFQTNKAEEYWWISRVVLSNLVTTVSMLFKFKLIEMK